MPNQPSLGASLCDCGKWITPTKSGLYRSHWTDAPEWPGSPNKKHCPRSRTPINGAPRGYKDA
jgi:hypothetical protein